MARDDLPALPHYFSIYPRSCVFLSALWFSSVVPGPDVLVGAGPCTVPLSLSEDLLCPLLPRPRAESRAFRLPVIQQRSGALAEFRRPPLEMTCSLKLGPDYREVLR